MDEAIGRASSTADEYWVRGIVVQELHAKLYVQSSLLKYPTVTFTFTIAQFWNQTLFVALNPQPRLIVLSAISMLLLARCRRTQTRTYLGIT